MAKPAVVGQVSSATDAGPSATTTYATGANQSVVATGGQPDSIHHV